MRRFAVLTVLVGCGGDAPTARVAGSVFADDNANGIRDPGELGIGGVVVYANLDVDPTINGLDPVTRTADDGTYELVVPGPGTYAIREVLPFGLRERTFAAKPRIIGGADVAAAELGFMVGLAYRFGESAFQFCGGSLITDRHVVTAAHCSIFINPDEVAIIAGTADPTGAGGQILAVQGVATHPTFNFDVFAGYDIAVWTLAEPIDLEATGLHTIELLTPETAALADPAVLATTVGWGATERATELLQQVHVPIVDEAECAAAYPTATNVSTQICAGVIEGGIDSCQGDSGGPLLVRDRDREVWALAGITSYGEGCALPGFPGVYARVSPLAEWARQQAIETSAPVDVTVERADTPGIVDFATQISTRPQVGPIEPRWQLTGFSLPDLVVPDTQLTAGWRILGDPDAPTDFTCSFDNDLLVDGTPQAIPCTLGETVAQLAGFPVGIFATSLTVSRDDVSFTRRVDLFAGEPPMIESTGALEAQDRIDPDFVDPFHIDYYVVDNLTGTRAFAVEVLAITGFSHTLTLYDARERSLSLGGGILQFGQTTFDGYSRIVVVPEPGVVYMLGVSSVEVAALGSYEIRIINDGVLTPF